MGGSRKKFNKKANRSEVTPTDKEKPRSELVNKESNQPHTTDATDGVWLPGYYIALKALVTSRLCSAMWGIVTDCDETYNYWEPTHYLLYGTGFQTWEYSPVYALRSYTYLLLHAVPAYLYGTFLQSNRMLIFFFVRCMVAMISAGCELYFYRGICKRFGSNVGRMYLGMTLFSAGMFISVAAYLPSSFAMYMVLLSYGAWLHNQWQLAIFTTALSTFLGWPFACIIGAPIAYDVLFLRKKHHMFFKWCIISTLTIMIPMVQIDTSYFGTFVIAPLKLVLYNVFTTHGPDLYGTSPASFYVFNGLLNFNIVFGLALASLPLYMIRTYVCESEHKLRYTMSFSMCISSMYLWLLIFTMQPHKEERFLFPIYPLLLFGGSVAIDNIQRVFSRVFLTQDVDAYVKKTSKLSLAILLLFGSLSVSRILSQYQGFSAPFDVFIKLNELHHSGNLAANKNYTVCYGKEWHRFPSSFFLPSEGWKVEFIASEFRGQLPKHFDKTPEGTSVIPTNMNDMNKEEVTRYVPLSTCDFIIDLETGRKTPREPIYSQVKGWEIVHSSKFLDISRSPLPFRAFYVPFLTELYCSYGDYVLLQRKTFSR